MRKRVVLAILAGMFVVLGVIVVGRFSDGVAAPSDGDAVAAADAGSDVGTWVAGDAASLAEVPDVGQVEPEKLDRPVRVIGRHWELLAPGIVANGGVKASKDSAFDAAGVEAKFRAADDMEDVREALALGGEAEKGADVAVMSLPSFVGSYEKLRALRPTVFYVVGWSRGYEAVASTGEDAFTRPRVPKTIELRGRPAEAGTYLSLLMLQLAGVPVGSVEIVDDAPDGKGLHFAAVNRGHEDLDDVPKGYDKLITSADAPRSVMYVAVAPSGFLQRHGEEVQAWAQVWSSGREKLSDDVPAAARMIARHDKKEKAYELIERLGALELASIRENARVAGLSGRPPLTLEDHFQLAWQIWRDVGVLSTPAPLSVPISTETIIGLARAEVAPDGTPQTADQEWSTERPILVHHVQGDHHDEEKLVRQAGLIAGVFERSALEISLGHEDLGSKIADEVAARYAVDRERISVSKGKHRRDQATLTVFAVD